MKKHILNVTVAAGGTPSEVRARIADQVKEAAESPEEAAFMAAARGFIDKAIEGVSEDQTLSVKGSVSIVVNDAPAVVDSRKAAETEAHAAALRTKDGQVTDLTTKLTEATSKHATTAEKLAAKELEATELRRRLDEALHNKPAQG